MPNNEDRAAGASAADIPGADVPTPGMVRAAVPAADAPVADTPTASALFLSAFFDELIRCGVRDVVVSPGSRSTPLSMVAYASDLRVHVDVDERGAAFLALGMAKAGGLPVCVICTSGTAVGNYYPAVLEAESSRVPLIVLTGDRPPRLQNLGAPQTCDQLKAFGDHVRHFQQMPLPGSSDREIAFARQMALTAFSRAQGSRQVAVEGEAGPVHFNFPFEEPLKPNLDVPGLFVCGRRALGEGREAMPALMACESRLPHDQRIESLIRAHRTIVFCGEGSFATEQQAQDLLAWAKRFGLPLIADPLSNLRSYSDDLVIDNYDNIFGRPGCPEFDLIIRFGRYPVSKYCFSAASSCAAQLVVDAYETRDFNASTDTFVRCTPAEFVASFAQPQQGGRVFAHGDGEAPAASFAIAEDPQEDAASATPDATSAAGLFDPTPQQQACAHAWITRNREEAERIAAVGAVQTGFEGAFIHRILELAPAGSCVFSASSLSIRMVDTFYLKAAKRLTVLCNRGLNGIDGTLSSAIGAAHFFSQTTFITGDLAFLHDVNALALQHELLSQGTAASANPDADASATPSIIVLLVNNAGGGIFEILPQKSEETYFERLFLTPQQVDFAAIVQGFGVPYRFAATVDDMAAAYQKFKGSPGIHVIEVQVEIEGLKERHEPFLP